MNGWNDVIGQPTLDWLLEEENQTDALEMLLILGQLGIRDERMREAAELVRRKRDAQGRWLQESTFGGKFLVDIEPKGQSKWITLRALEALKRFLEN